MATKIRQAFGLLLAGALLGTGFAASTAIADSFTDVPDGTFFADEIDWLTDNDIANGFADGTFDPQGPIKRQQAALWFANMSDSIELVVETKETPPIAASQTLSTDCPGDKRVVGGGGLSIGAAELFMTRSAPADDNTWRVDWTTPTGTPAEPDSLRVWALCVPRLANP